MEGSDNLRWKVLTDGNGGVLERHVWYPEGTTFEKAFSKSLEETCMELELKIDPAKRFDNGKPRYDLIPADGLDALVAVYTYGAQKYTDRNWERGMSWSRCFASLLRHTWKWWRGEDYDDESKLPHMSHVAWNAMALLTYQLRKIGTDDRPPSS